MPYWSWGPAELGADQVPDELEELHALLGRRDPGLEDALLDFQHSSPRDMTFGG
jgi:hypothetical protein